jgi:branched-chain amino acid transport system substrate-binding protein
MKHSSKIARVFLIAAALLLAGLLPLSGAWAEEAPEEIVIHHIGDITGPYAPITGAAAAYAMPDAEKYFNEQGGVKGVKVRIVTHDTRNKRDVALAKYAEIAAENPPLIVLHQSADMEVLKDRLAEDKIPALGFSPTPKTIWPKGWIFQTLPTYADQFALFIDWLRSDWKKEGKIRIAFVNPDYSYGHSIFSPQTEKYMAENNIEVVAKEFFPPFDMDATTQMTRVAATSPDVIYSMTIASQPRVVLKSAETVGLIDSALFGMGCWGMDRGAAEVAGKLMEGVVGVQPYWVPTDDQPIARKFVEAFMEKDRPSHQLTMAYCGFCTVNAMAVETLGETVERTGWDGLDGPAVYKTLENTESFEARGFQPFQFSPGKRSSLLARVVKIEDGDVVPLSEWTACPDMRPEEYR